MVEVGLSFKIFFNLNHYVQQQQHFDRLGNPGDRGKVGEAQGEEAERGRGMKACGGGTP
jgi:hypothetical protein